PAGSRTGPLRPLRHRTGHACAGRRSLLSDVNLIQIRYPLVTYLVRTRLSTRTAKTASPRKRLTAAARREVIERAATELFAERGFHGASMEEVARRSGVSVPVVYDHFESKRALHRRLLERHYAELREV